MISLSGRAALIADMVQCLLRVSGWLTVSVLAAMGLLVLFFLALGDFTATGFFLHLDNIAHRYSEADVARQERFLAQAGIAGALVLELVGLCRFGSLRSIFRASESRA